MLTSSCVTELLYKYVKYPKVLMIVLFDLFLTLLLHHGSVAGYMSTGVVSYIGRQVSDTGVLVKCISLSADLWSVISSVASVTLQACRKHDSALTSSCFCFYTGVG